MKKSPIESVMKVGKAVLNICIGVFSNNLYLSVQIKGEYLKNKSI